MLCRIFLAVAGMSANAGLLVLAILAVRLVTRRRMPKWGNCLLWGLVAVCLMCPVLPESVLSARCCRKAFSASGPSRGRRRFPPPRPWRRPPPERGLP